MNKDTYNELIDRIEIKDVILGNAHIERHRPSSEQWDSASVDVKVSAEKPVIVGDELWAKARFTVETKTVEAEENESKALFSLQFVIDARYSIRHEGEDNDTIDLAAAEDELS